MRTYYVIAAILIAGATAQESFKCPDDFGFYPHHISCDKYWKCDNNVAELKTCGNGLAFDASDSKFLTENCDYLHNVDCGDRTQLEPAISTPHCPRLYGIFPDEKKCDVFWNCWNGEASKYQCSPGLAYDREARVCMWADQVPECKNEEVAGGFTCPAAGEVSGASGSFSRHAHPDVAESITYVWKVSRESTGALSALCSRSVMPMAAVPAKILKTFLDVRITTVTWI